MRRNGEGRDSPIALWVARRLYGMNVVHQLGLGTDPIQNGPEGPMPVAKEHGELGMLQTFDPGGAPLVGGGVPSGGAVSSQPSSVPLLGGSDVPAFARFSGGLNGV